MSKEKNSLARINYFLEPGSIALAEHATVISTVLGSCIAVCLYDRKRKVGAMNHFQFPSVQKRHLATARYGNVATLALVRMMCKDGSKAVDLEAQIFGGAYNPQVSSTDIGRENLTVARRILSRLRIPILSEDVGGGKGRKLVFDTGTNEIAVLKVDKLRAKDWYPYEDNR